MPHNIENIKKLLKENFPSSHVEIEDTMGDGNHLEITIKSDMFLNKSDIQRHQMVYALLGNLVGNEIHAVAMNLDTISEDTTSNAVHKTIDIDKLEKDSILNTIHEAISKYDVILFMKGNKENPMCGFSATVNNILKNLQVNFVDVNVLSSNEIREGIKLYSNWPTIPQLYIKGSFIGGCDIVTLMYENGSLINLLKKYSLI